MAIGPAAQYTCVFIGNCIDIGKREGAELAAASIDSGAAGEKLEALIEFTNR